SATFTCKLPHPDMKSVQGWLDGSPQHNNFVTEISEQYGTVHTPTLKEVACHDSSTVTFQAGSLLFSAELLVRGILLWR
ncbi:OBSCN protein, partial [Crypturellus soui]|nr:OBSCN protein [Crypturellus soui]